MKHHSTTKLTSLPYNEAVKRAYFKILKGSKLLLSTIYQHELRCTLCRSNKPGTMVNTIDELVNPLLYLSLECNDGERYSIHFGFELFKHECEYSVVTSKFVRLLYKLTSTEHTTINIEDCVNTEYVITDCSALFEAVEDSNNKQHKLTVIQYKPAAIKRKQMKAVA